jgi:hypothetical protein
VSQHLDISTTALRLPLYAIIIVAGDSVLAVSVCFLASRSRDFAVVRCSLAVFHNRKGVRDDWREAPAMRQSPDELRGGRAAITNLRPQSHSRWLRERLIGGNDGERHEGIWRSVRNYWIVVDRSPRDAQSTVPLLTTHYAHWGQHRGTGFPVGRLLELVSAHPRVRMRGTRGPSRFGAGTKYPRCPPSQPQERTGYLQ